MGHSGAQLLVPATFWKAAIVPWPSLGSNAEALQLSVGVPEPGSLTLLVLGGMLLGLAWRRRRS
jgi:hypothetical protein